MNLGVTAYQRIARLEHVYCLLYRNTLRMCMRVFVPFRIKRLSWWWVAYAAQKGDPLCAPVLVFTQGNFGFGKEKPTAHRRKSITSRYLVSRLITWYVNQINYIGIRLYYLVEISTAYYKNKRKGTHSVTRIFDPFCYTLIPVTGSGAVCIGQSL